MADKITRAKPTVQRSADVGIKSTLQNVKKWLKSLGVDTELTIPARSIPMEIQHGILFLDSLRSMNFPQESTPLRDSLLKIMAELHDKSEPGSASSKSDKTNKNKPGKEKRSSENAMEIDAVRKPGPKSTGLKKGVKKPAPLSEVMNNLNIRDYKGCGCKGNCKSKICGCRKKNLQCNASCKCLEDCLNKAEVAEEVEEKAADVEEKAEEVDEQAEEENNLEEEDKNSDDDCSSKSKSEGSDMSSENEDLEKENIDWNRHISTLVKCPKCKRNFFAARVEYHMQVCKMI